MLDYAKWEKLEVSDDPAPAISSLPMSSAFIEKGIFDAARRGDVGTVERFLEEEGSECTDENGCTLLMGAAILRLPVLLDLILRRGADPNARDHSGSTALMRALRF